MNIIGSFDILFSQFPFYLVKMGNLDISDFTYNQACNLLAID